jgi:Chromo (CHRromatin Organisation MOdifier) domain
MNVGNFYSDFFNSNVKDKKALKNQELYNLYQKPKKETKVESPHYNFAYSKNYNHQADLLFLPEDKGYKYALVITDIATKLSDAEPLKDKTSLGIKKAMEKIYSRGILKVPDSITMDPGKEFKGDLIPYMKKNKIVYKYGKPGRHRQLSVVERTNQYLAKGLLLRMTAQELLTGEPSREWVDDLPNFITYINKKRSDEPPELPKKPTPVCSGDDCKLLDIGTKVRTQLDNPIDVATDKRVHGRFRVTDIRWDPVIRIIKNILLLPSQPPLYQLDDKNKDNQIDTLAAYTKKQLQVVPENEQAPPKSVIRGKPDSYVAEKIIGKKKMKNRIYYKIKWKGFPESEATFELRTKMLEDVPQLVEQYEAA